MRGRVVRRDLQGNDIEELKRYGSWPSALIEQLEIFAEHIKNKSHQGSVSNTYLEHIALIEAAYKSASESRAVNPRDLLEELEKANS